MIELYIMETCPYCRKVTDFLYDKKIEYVKKDVSDIKNAEELMKFGGKNQVPFMIDGDTKMYESADIIEYVRKKHVL